jgi:hypothetical protein
VGGLVLMATGLPGVRRRLSLRNVVRRHVSLDDLLDAAHRSQVWRLGFYGNWIGALGTTSVMIIAVLLLTPPAAWGMAVLLLIDFAATMALRWPLHRGHLKHDSRSGAPASLPSESP